MTSNNQLKMLMAAATSFTVGLTTVQAFPAMAESYQFTVTNNTQTTLTRLSAVAVDGSMEGDFDLGNGIPPGVTRTIIWAEYTNDSPCDWSLKGGYSDGSETDPATFNFCEETDLVFDE